MCVCARMHVCRAHACMYSHLEWTDLYFRCTRDPTVSGGTTCVYIDARTRTAPLKITICAALAAFVELAALYLVTLAASYLVTLAALSGAAARTQSIVAAKLFTLIGYSTGINTTSAERLAA